MLTKHDQVIKDEADAERKYQEGQVAEGKTKAEIKASSKRTVRIDLSPLAADAPVAESTLAVQSALMDLETKRTFELLIDEIRRQMGGGTGEPGTGGVPASVVTDLNNLRDNIMQLRTSLDADAGVATDTFVAEGTPPPITTV